VAHLRAIQASDTRFSQMEVTRIYADTNCPCLAVGTAGRGTAWGQMAVVLVVAERHRALPWTDLPSLTESEFRGRRSVALDTSWRHVHKEVTQMGVSGTPSRRDSSATFRAGILLPSSRAPPCYRSRWWGTPAGPVATQKMIRIP
jgi:hypothetical protein